MTHATLCVDTSCLPPRRRRGLEALGDDSFPGLPDGATRQALFSLIKRAGPALGMRDTDIAHLSYLLNYTKESDWEAGAVGPVVYQAVDLMAAEREVCDRQINYREHKLHDLGLIRWRDQGNFRRYGKRDPEGRLLFACGVDLSPLAERFGEFVRLKAERDARLEAFAAAKRRYARLRRQIHLRLLEAKARAVDVGGLSSVHKALPRLEASMIGDRAAALIETAQGLVERLDALLAAHSLTERAEPDGSPDGPAPAQAPVDNAANGAPAGLNKVWTDPQNFRPVGKKTSDTYNYKKTPTLYREYG